MTSFNSVALPLVFLLLLGKYNNYNYNIGNYNNDDNFNNNTHGSGVNALDSICEGDGCTTKLMFDAVARMQGEAEFDGVIWSRLASCMLQTTTPKGVNFLTASDTAWAGVVRFATNNGSATNSPSNSNSHSDDWPDSSWSKNSNMSMSMSTSNDPWVETDGFYIEANLTLLVPFSASASTSDRRRTAKSTIPDGSKVLINEPCNVASNFAYYRSMLALCDNAHEWGIEETSIPWLTNTFGHLGWGSLVFHAAYTQMGFFADNQPIANLAYIAHQNAVRQLPYNPILHDLSLTPRPFSGVEAAQEFDRIVTEEDPFSWLPNFEQLFDDTPAYFITFTAIMSDVLLLTLPAPMATGIIESISSCGFVTPEQAEFVIQIYIPTAQQSLRDAGVDDLPFGTRVALLQKLVGILIKILFGFIWQERFIPGPQISSRLMNVIGAHLIGPINFFGNGWTGFDRSSDPDVQNANNVYPGEARCRKGSTSAHSKWHEQSANVIVDVVLLAEAINEVVGAHKKSSQ